VELREFVKETLVQITQGVRDAQVLAREAGGAVSPALTAFQQAESYLGRIEGNHPVFLVDFDVAVTATKGKGAGAEAKVTIAPFSVGAGGKVNQAEEKTSRVKFKVPVALPIDEASKAERDRAAAESKRKADAALAATPQGARNW
jgi:hypothetical protein